MFGAAAGPFHSRLGHTPLWNLVIIRGPTVPFPGQMKHPIRSNSLSRPNAPRPPRGTLGKSYSLRAQKTETGTQKNIPNSW